MTDDPIASLEPPPYLAPPQRNWVGWIGLALMLGLLCVGQLATYFTRDTKTPEIGYLRYVEEFQIQVKLKQLRTLLPQQPKGTDDWSALDKPLTALRKKLGSDPMAARLYAAMQYESGRKVQTSDLAVLKARKDKFSQAFLKIYGSDKLSAAEFEVVKGQLDLAKFVHKVALVHAREKAGLPGKRNSLFSRSQLVTFATAIGGIVVLLVLGLAGFVILVATSSPGKFPGHPAGGLSVEQADRFAVRAAQIFAASLLLGLLMEATGKADDSRGYTWRLLVSALGTIALTLVMYRRPIAGYASTGLAEIGVQVKGSFRWAGWGLLAAIANIPIFMVLTMIGQLVFRGLPPPEHPIETIITSSPSPLLIAAIFFTACVQAPFFEEVFFRGTLLPALATLTKSPIAAGVVSSLLFAVIHPTGIPAWPALAAIGGMSAFLTYRTGSLTPSMYMHAFHNGGTILFALVIASN